MSQPQDDLNRSWVRRGYAWGTPTWGHTVPALFRETAVLFYRRIRGIDEYGNVDGNSAETVVWDTTAHCEIVELRAQQLGHTMPSGLIFSRQWNIYTAWPTDLDKVPREGDFVRFETIDGKNVDMKIKHVYADAQLADHLQVETIEFE